MLVIAQDDLEDATPISWEEVPTYALPYPLPPSSRSLGNDKDYSEPRPQPELSRRGKRVVYVEHAITGELTPVFLENPQEINYDEIEEDIARKEDTEIEPLLQIPGDDPHSLRNRRPSLDFPTVTGIYLRVIFLLVQGVLAGYSFTTIYIQNAVEDTAFNGFFNPIPGIPSQSRVRLLKHIRTTCWRTSTLFLLADICFTCW